MCVWVCWYVCMLMPWPPFQLSRKFYHLRFSFTWVSFHIKRSKNKKQNYALLLPLPLARLFEGFFRPACYKVKTKGVKKREREKHTQPALKFLLKKKIRSTLWQFFRRVPASTMCTWFLPSSLVLSVFVSLSLTPSLARSVPEACFGNLLFLCASEHSLHNFIYWRHSHINAIINKNPKPKSTDEHLRLI